MSLADGMRHSNLQKSAVKGYPINHELPLIGVSMHKIYTLAPCSALRMLV